MRKGFIEIVSDGMFKKAKWGDNIFIARIFLFFLEVASILVQASNPSEIFLCLFPQQVHYF